MSPPIRHTNLSRARTRFIGRQRELSALADCIARGDRLIALVGPPGVGKTRLARHFASGRLGGEDKPAGGVWMCSLTSATTAQGMIEAVAGALKINVHSKGGEAEARERLTLALLSRGPVLIVLDNFEQLVGSSEALALVELWLDACPELVCLITSRIRPGVPGEVSLELAGLGQQEAIELFSERRQSRLSRVQSDEVKSHIAEIVERLDGLPLAVELAAARANVLSLADMRRRLSDHLDLLKDGRATHSTLREAIDWSWQHLGEDEREVLSACSVFHGGFTLEAAESILPHSDEHLIVDLLSGLRDQSMVYALEPEGAAGELRFGVYESIRVYAAEKLHKGSLEAIRERHANWFAGQAERWRARCRGAQAAEHLMRVRLDLDNILGAARWALDHAPETAARALLALAETGQLNDRMVAHMGLYDSAIATLTQRPKLRARALITRSRLKYVLGDQAGARQDLELASTLANSSDRLGVEIAIELGTLIHHCGNNAEGRRLLTPALARAREMGARRLIGHGLHSQTIVALFAQSLVEARRCAEEALEVHQRLGDVWRTATSLTLLAAVCGLEGNWTQEVEHLERALTHYDALDDLLGSARCSLLLGVARLRRSTAEEVEVILERALLQNRQGGERRGAGTALLYLGLLCLMRGDLDRAEAHLKEAQEAHRHTTPRGTTIDLAWLGVVSFQRGALPLALDRLTRAQDAAQALGDAHTEARAAFFRALTLAATGRPSRDAFERARETLSRCEDPESAAILTALEAQMGLTPTRHTTLEGSTVLALVHGALATIHRDTTALVVEGKGRWFQVEGGEIVELASRKHLRAILVGLLELRLTRPGQTLTLEGVQALGWPGETLLPEAGRNRVYVAIRALRQMGLRGLLLTHEGGYFLDPDQEARWD